MGSVRVHFVGGIGTGIKDWIFPLLSLFPTTDEIIDCGREREFPHFPCTCAIPGYGNN